MASLAHYYGQAKSGFGHISTREAEAFGEDMLVVAATGAAIGAAANMLGGLDKTIVGISVPLDGVASVGLGYAGLATGGGMGKALKIASIAAGGSAAVRSFESFFKKMGIGVKVKGEFEELGGQFESLPSGSAFSFGQQDRLVESAKYL